MGREKEAWKVVSGSPVPPKGERAMVAQCGKGGSESHSEKMVCGSIPCARWTPTILNAAFAKKYVVDNDLTEREQ